MENDPKAFVFWLQGYLELSGATTLNEQQVRVIKEHLALVLDKKTPVHYEPPILYTPSILGGVKCGICNKICSEEGGVCRKCRTITTSSDSLPLTTVTSQTATSDAVTSSSKVDAEKIYCKYLDPFENPSDSTDEIVNVPTALTC